MAYTSMLTELPPDGINVNIICDIYPSLPIIGVFDSGNQLFTTVSSGLIIPAYSVIEWELI